MATIDGQWDATTQTPMGEQKSVLTIVSKGDGSFAGVNAGPMGSMDIEDGQVLGDQIRFRMEMKLPFPMSLEGKATLNGDEIEGAISAGAFGSMAFHARRKG